MATWKLLLEYDGGRYSGWQEQPNARTVQGELRKAAEEFFGASVEMQGAGRTDAGVHARGQVAHLRVQARKNASPPQLTRALNEALPADIVVLEASLVPPKFHARHDAIIRSYVYQISTRKSAFAKRYVWWVKEPLDVELMSRAAALLVGRHDFTAFRALDPSRPEESPIVVVASAEVVREQHLILFRIEASHFIWRMVRRMVGVLVKLGKREITMGNFEKLLSGRVDPKLDVAAWTAPASGLFLEKVGYRQS